MEQVYQFVDDIELEGGATIFAPLPMISDHPETRFQEFWSAACLADALEAEGFSIDSAMRAGSPERLIASW